MLRKILIANRGEIAVRIIKACRELGILSVAVYSEADKNSLHVKLADEAYCIGASQAKKSYLDISRIMTIAVHAKADAIHPGYGFLAENANFAKACVNANIIFIGPSSRAIANMGDKAIARRTMAAASVPIVPGTKDLITDFNEAKKIAENIGYPVLIKATAGGGGKGMRVVESSADLEKALHQAAQEAERSFGNAGVYLEKYLIHSRHVEIQIMADNYGNAVYLGERDCSVQRRHQKLLEEAPSPIMNKQLREKMGNAAVAAAKAVNYSGAGTVEFIVDEQKNFYFMEMNTRIQVEHPVTEMITGTDLIKTQILVASGETLPWSQNDIHINGWALECRINAEDPYNNFMPCPGTIKTYKPPSGKGIRIDSAMYAGNVITPFYDSMIAKVIVWAPTRSKAIEKMAAALKDFTISGVKTTIDMHRKLLTDKIFCSGKADTNYLEDHLEEILKKPFAEPKD
ncbi:acetyl-CoA carboxylase biotin carboxylase subunit [Pectinatus cerevisiiphilus]|uniref:Biotin carboxylase n=1 Tax=Pectinatus cerevisiiphilus TaxID=86956 RepID=A0A4R3KAH8_9FIRM|nr:acetyl-CoA carboxylase biotin carboxylase subunit [Pectinatus cerevisiiphilus]TCS80106.1 acetyl-CoA carboxylase biotin carboxylase subunit [Pectinatus cerevisiiphilus]